MMVIQVPALVSDMQAAEDICRGSSQWVPDMQGMDYFSASSQCRTLPLAWSQAPIVVTTSRQGSCINRSLVLPPRILLITVIFCLTLVFVHWGLIPMTSGSCSCYEHTTNLATGVSRQPVRNCGTIFHPDCGSRDFPSILSDDLWKHISLATEALSDSFDLGAM